MNLVGSGISYWLYFYMAHRGGETDLKCQIKRRGGPREVRDLIPWLICADTAYINGVVQHIDVDGYVRIQEHIQIQSLWYTSLENHAAELLNPIIN